MPYKLDYNDTNVSLTEEKSQQLTTMWQKFWKTEYNDINKKVEKKINDEEGTTSSAEE